MGARLTQEGPGFGIILLGEGGLPECPQRQFPFIERGQCLPGCQESVGRVALCTGLLDDQDELIRLGFQARIQGDCLAQIGYGRLRRIAGQLQPHFELQPGIFGKPVKQGLQISQHLSKIVVQAISVKKARVNLAGGSSRK